MTTITMRHGTNFLGQQFLGFYNGSKLVGEVDPRDGKYHVFYGFNRPSLIGIHADRDRAINHLQCAIRAGITGRVSFYPDNLSLA